MFFYMTGDLFQSNAEALVNTVNCEGYMGKGIAYQFKLQFPENNASYVKACKSGNLHPGQLHYYTEHEKIIINFPTKDRWREKSKMEYIEQGLDALVILIQNLKLKSIAIPPLGSGNGGLIWSEVKAVMLRKLESISSFVSIYIYEPSHQYFYVPITEPKLSASALVLMEIKNGLSRFNGIRLQKASFFMNIFYGKKYFSFAAHKYGPYDHSINIISKKIKEFQQYHNTSSTKEAQQILYYKLTSESVNNLLAELQPHIQSACKLVNSISTDHELECLSTICYLINEANNLTSGNIIEGFKNWSEEKAKRFSEVEIVNGIRKLHELGIIEECLIGYIISS